MKYLFIAIVSFLIGSFSIIALIGGVGDSVNGVPIEHARFVVASILTAMLLTVGCYFISGYTFCKWREGRKTANFPLRDFIEGARTGWKNY